MYSGCSLVVSDFLTLTWLGYTEGVVAHDIRCRVASLLQTTRREATKLRHCRRCGAFFASGNGHLSGHRRSADFAQSKA